MVDNLDVPIALRKGVRSCTQYPISSYLTYSKVSPKYRDFTSKLDHVEIPNNVYEALQD